MHSLLLDWGKKGWTATLRPTDQASELRWRPRGASRDIDSDCGSSSGRSGRSGGGGGTSRVFVGSWGGHEPEYKRSPVPAGTHTFVLAVSGKADNYGGWARALHKEAGIADGSVQVLPGQTTVVELRLTLGSSEAGGAPTTVEG